MKSVDKSTLLLHSNINHDIINELNSNLDFKLTLIYLS